MDEETIFKALADEHRRKLLDLLFQQDGQTLSQLEAHLPMTRFGAMKHLQILEDAGLLTTKKVGREKFHYLNPVPIQQVYERWVSKYAQPWLASLTTLKSTLEDKMTDKPSHIFQIYIRTTPERLWDALTNGDMTRQYYFNTRIESTWEVDAPYTYEHPEGFTMIEGEVLESDPPRRLVTSFRPLWRRDADSLITSKVTFEIEAVGEACKLTLTHDDLIYSADLIAGMKSGWSQILSSLKTLLETGEALPTLMPPI